MNTNEIELLKGIGGFRLCEDYYWHLLELINDGNDRDDCRLCHQSRLGPTYECKESGCGFLLHKSCAEQPRSQDVGHEHDLDEINHMIFIKELENEDKKVCSICEKPLSGSAFKCFFLTCNFLLHQLCADIPYHLDKHPAHSHGLSLRGPLEDMHCDLCSKLCNRCFSYQCSEYCNFSIHVRCAARDIVTIENCHSHKFFTVVKDVGQITCQACGQRLDEIVYFCEYCRLLIHWRCAKTYKRNIRTKECGHSLTCTFSLPPTEHKCRVCKDSVDKRYAAYICDICKYAAHLWCAYAILDSTEDKTEMLQEIQNHFSHPEHKLILSYEEPTQHQVCIVCMDHIISPPFYGCAPCKFFLHERCGTLPSKIKPFFNDRLTLVLQPQGSSFQKWCSSCMRTGFGFVYSDGPLFLDIQCGLLQKDLKHKGHQHRLFFGYNVSQNCNACNAQSGLFTCRFCIFNLCLTCVTYPLYTWHRDHEHLLNLTYKIEDDSGEYYCLICEKERDPSHWFYSCQDCNFVAHLECVYPRDRSLIEF